MSITTAAAICIAAWLAVAALSGSAVRARLSFWIAVALLPLPWIVAAPYEHRVILAFAIGFLFTSAADFAVGRKPARFPARLAYVLAFAALIDPMTARPERRRFDPAAALRMLAAVCFGGVAVATWIAVATLAPATRITVRLAGAALLILAVAEATTELAQVITAACGIRLEAIHDQPYRSLTLSEFWSRRWNRMGGRWFRQHVFVPLRGHGVSVALFSLFAVSGAMHVYLIAPVVTPGWLLSCAGFFLLQPPLLLIERRMGVRRWPPFAARFWTLAILTVLLPLVLVPLLAALHIAL